MAYVYEVQIDEAVALHNDFPALEEYAAHFQSFDLLAEVEVTILKISIHPFQYQTN